jgi:AAA ATPase domain
MALVARESELNAIDRALDRTRSVLLAGPPGVGKTRLARAALSARGRRERLRWLAASASARPIPLGAFVPVLGPPPVDAAAGLPGILAHAYSSLCAQQRLILSVDDAHLLDDVSATLLHQLAAERAVSLIITLRSGAPAPAAVTALWKDELVTRIDVETLSATKTGAILEAVLEGTVAGETARRLHQATRGNLLWLRHLVAGERAAGRLALRDGLWAWTGEPELTPALADLVDTHIGPLRNGVRPVVEVLALSQPLPLTVLESLTDPSSVDHAVDRGLIHIRDRPDGAEARLAHPLYGEVVRATIGHRRARRRRGQIATALAATDDSPDQLLRRAVLSLDSDLVPDTGLLTAAAHHASRRADAVLATRLLAAACQRGAGFDTHLAHAFALHWSIHCEQAKRPSPPPQRGPTPPEQRPQPCGRPTRLPCRSSTATWRPSDCGWPVIRTRLPAASTSSARPPTARSRRWCCPRWMRSPP